MSTHMFTHIPMPWSVHRQQVDDAVLTSSSSFALTAFATTGRSPVSVNIRTSDCTTCQRSAWDFRVSDFRWRRAVCCGPWAVPVGLGPWAVACGLWPVACGCGLGCGRLCCVYVSCAVLLCICMCERANLDAVGDTVARNYIGHN